MASGLNYSFSKDSERSGDSGSVTCSDGDFSDKASSSYTDEYEPAWIDKVSSTGILFYIEPFANLNDEESISECKDQNPDEKNSIIIEESEEKPSTTGKLKNWIQHRKKNIKKKFSGKSNKGRNSLSEERSLLPKVPSNRSSSCDLKEVFLSVDLSKHNYGRRATLAEKLFGLILSSNSIKSGCEAVTVCELTPEGEAHKEGSIKIGDWIKSIDDVDVSLSNIENVLNNIQSPKKVKIVIQRDISRDTSSNFLGENCLRDIQSLCQWLEGSNSIEKLSSKFSHVPHAVYFLSLGQESSSKDNGDVIYSFPNQEGQLFRQKGMFVTLGHMISDIATPPMLSCSLATDLEIVHVGYAIEGQKIMVLCIPNSCANAVEVKHYTHGVVKFLKLQFSTLSRAFEETFNKVYLDQFFNVFYHSLFLPGISEKVHIGSHFLDVMPSVYWLPLPFDLKIVVDDILCQFESADFEDDPDGYYDMQRIYSILGACMFYKGCLLGSHLNKDDLLDVHLLLKYQKLLSMTQHQPVCQAVIWREIHPTRKELKRIPDPDYIETDGRYFLLAVALRSSIIATVLEAGGCSLKVSGHPSPDPFFVDQVENALLTLEESGIYPAVDKIIDNQDPPLADPENFLKSEKSNWELLSSMVNFNRPFPNQHSARSLSRRSQSFSNLSSDVKGKQSEMSLKNSFGVEVERQQLLTNMGPADGESDTEANVANDDSSRTHNRSCSISNSSNTGSHDSDESFLFQRSTKRIYSSSYDVRSSLSSQDQYEIDGEDSGSWLVSGCGNTLFYYLHMDPVEGVFLAPTDKMRKILHGPLGIKVLNSFFSSCLSMRTTFERSLRNRELSVRTISPKFGINSFLQAVHEQGALFQISISDSTNQKKITEVLDFWVVGRLFFAPEPREVYVCYQDSAEQDVMELAFRLGFGLSL